MLAGFAESPAQLRHGHRDARIAGSLVGPHLRRNGFFRDHVRSLPYQQLEQIEGLGGNRHRVISVQQQTAPGVEAEAAKPRDHRLRFADP